VRVVAGMYLLCVCYSRRADSAGDA